MQQEVDAYTHIHYTHTHTLTALPNLDGAGPAQVGGEEGRVHVFVELGEGDALHHLCGCVRVKCVVGGLGVCVSVLGGGMGVRCSCVGVGVVVALGGLWWGGEVCTHTHIYIYIYPSTMPLCLS